MSLTTFLKIKDVKERFKQEFAKPNFSAEKSLLAPPLTKNYSVVGTAFDYLFRFYLKRLNAKAIEHKWVAEHSLMIEFESKQGFILDLTTGKMCVEPDEVTDKADLALFHKIERILSEARSRYQVYLKTGKITKPLLTSVILLANLDLIIRVGGFGDYVELDVVSGEDIKDLTKLVEIINPKIFKATKNCFLNPTFGEASRLVGGADADLIIDDTLIEIKTVKKLELKRDYFDQLIGYYCLYRIGGINGFPEDCEIKNFAVYFSRHAYLHLIPVKDCIGQVNFQKFLKWFEERARK